MYRRLAKHYPFELPPLPYDYDALEPFIDAQTMHLHHDKHHRGYVDGLNNAMEEIQKARSSGDYDVLDHWQRQLSFNWAGHRNHALFWESMCSPMQSGRPKGTLGEAIDENFGSLQTFHDHFIEAALSVEGSGWAMLCFDPPSGLLEVETVQNHQYSFPPGLQPLLPVDVWEHAYYLSYQNDREQYLHAFWNVIDWKQVDRRLEKLLAARYG